MVYCQHVLGIGHLCRIMLILQQLNEHRVTLVLGGPPVAVPLPDHVLVVQLPGLRMDEKFSGLLTVDPGRNVALIKEQRVIDCLNRFFHILLVHGDPALIRLDETFSRMADIRIPVTYTGYICQPPQAGDRQRMRRQLQLADADQLIVVSAGSGSVGMSLLRAAMDAFALLAPPGKRRLQVFTGPYIADHTFNQLAGHENSSIRIERFSNDFPSWLAAADLSISMGGYNTTMNLVAAGCRALVYPFAQNHEQRMRAERLAERGCLQLLSEPDLAPGILADKINEILTRRPRSADIMLDGAVRTAEQLTTLARGEVTA
jgi:predicted glycosyltransferase